MNNAMELIRYSDIILSCFIPGQMLTESRIASHALVFVRSGVMEAKSAGRKFTVPAGGFVYFKARSRGTDPEAKRRSPPLQRGEHPASEELSEGFLPDPEPQEFPARGETV